MADSLKCEKRFSKLQKKFVDGTLTESELKSLDGAHIDEYDCVYMYTHVGAL